MFKRILLGGLLVLAMAAPTAVEAQAVATVYVGTHHSPWAAGILEFFTFPTAGFAYAGDWSRGLLPNAVRVGTSIAFLATYDDATEECTGSCPVWGTASIAAGFWAVVGAVNTARDHNERVREPRSLVLFEPSPNGGVSSGMRLGWSL